MCRKVDDLSRVCMAAAVATVEGQNGVQSGKNCSGYRARCSRSWFPSPPPNDTRDGFEKINRNSDDESFKKVMYMSCWINN
ncbi:hypothetical protein ACS0TY_000002 [Phlomoides rotata]